MVFFLLVLVKQLRISDSGSSARVQQFKVKIIAVRYWEINVSGWCNTQTVCGEDMSEEEAIQATGAKSEDCWVPKEVSRKQYAATVRHNSRKN